MTAGDDPRLVPRRVAAPGGRAASLLQSVPALNRAYRPTPWARGEHMQTVVGLARNLAISSTSSYARQLIPCADGGTVALDWWTGPSGWAGEEAGYEARAHRHGRLGPTAPGEAAGHEPTHHARSFGPAAPVLIVLHGLTGSGGEGYIKGACAAATAAGWRAAVLTYRGCGGLPLTSPRPYTADGTADAAAALAAAAAAYPASPAFAAVGYSLGAIILTKLVAELEAGAWPAAPPLTTAVCISSPFCLESAAARLEEPWTAGRLYNRALASRLGSYFKEHEAELRSHPAVREKVLSARRLTTISAWDETIVAAMAGHASTGAYYAAASSAAHIPGITRTPTLFLAAADDPFLGSLPEVEVLSAPATALAVAAHGGHCAFLQGCWPWGRAWSDDVLVQWLSAVMAEREKRGGGCRGGSGRASAVLAEEKEEEERGGDSRGGGRARL